MSVLSVCVMMTLAACAAAEPKTDPDVIAGQILLCGEEHADQKCLDKELEYWQSCYGEGMRDLFVELPSYMAEYLNMWMQEETDEILDQFWRDTEGTAIHSRNVLDFYRQIKTTCPETVFRGTDVGHMYSTTGQRYLDDLEAAGQKDSEAYLLAQEIIEQGKTFYDMERRGDKKSTAYREKCMAENFIRIYDQLNGADIMGIYGAMHTDPEGMDYAGTGPSMAKMLAEYYGNVIRSENLMYAEAERIDTLNIAGKEYQASYFGSQDLSQTLPDYSSREFWRLENAYEDFRDAPLTSDVLPYNNYPMQIETGQVFVIDYTMKNGTKVRKYYRSDGVEWNNLPSTQEFKVNE